MVPTSSGHAGLSVKKSAARKAITTTQLITVMLMRSGLLFRLRVSW